MSAEGDEQICAADIYISIYLPDACRRGKADLHARYLPVDGSGGKAQPCASYLPDAGRRGSRSMHYIFTLSLQEEKKQIHTLDIYLMLAGWKSRSTCYKYT
jgi:hypothetical protein